MIPPFPELHSFLQATPVPTLPRCPVLANTPQVSKIYTLPPFPTLPPYLGSHSFSCGHGWAMLVTHLHCPRTCVLALSRTTTPITLPPAVSGSVLGLAPGLHSPPARTFRLCFHLLRSSSSEGPHGSAPADAHILGCAHPPPPSHPPPLPIPFQTGVHPFYSPDNGALMAELVSTFTFV